MSIPFSVPKRMFLALLLACGLFLMSGVNAQQIVIENLRDIDFGEVAPSVGNLETNFALCVAVDQNVRYQIFATGDGLGGAFTLFSGPYSIPFSVQYTDRRQPRGFQELLATVPLAGLRARPNFNGVCRRTNAHVRVRVQNTDLLAAAGGSYSGTLVLMVSPE